MLVAQSVGYVGKQLQSGFIGFLNEDQIFASISIETGTSPQQGEALFAQFREELKKLQVTNLSTFESQITNVIVTLNFPAQFSLSIGFLYNDALYVKTIGQGQVYFRRGKEFDILMEGDKCASGFLQEYDMAIFTTTKINELLGEVEDIKAFVGQIPPRDMYEKMQHEDYGDDSVGFVGLFVEYLSQEAAEIMPPVEVTSDQPLSSEMQQTSAGETTPPLISVDAEQVHASGQSMQPATPSVSTEPPVVTSVEDPQVGPTPTTPQQQPVATANEVADTEKGKKRFSLPFLSSFRLHQSRKISMFIVIILFGILVWSVVFGYQRRMAAEQQKKFETTKEQIQENLLKAEEDAYLDLDASLLLIEESKEQLELLKIELGESKSDKIAEIALLIEETESKIVKKDEIEAVEFYDLGLEAENAAGKNVYLEGEVLSILDTNNKTIYILSLDSKSIEKYTSSELSAATLVATYEGDVFFLNSSSGIYKFTSKTKAELVIQSDDWGRVVDMALYNGNVYVLDDENDEIYKYLVAENGYSNATSYFASGQSANLAGSVGLAIDSSIYVARSEDVLKYVSGVNDSFTTSYPEETPSLSGIYTDAEIDQVYVWDTSIGAIFILGKNGEYVKQVASSPVRESKGIFVYEDEAYVFDGKKLYTLSLD